ncbi:MAG: MarR family winged helix-turn-helix transcriptional regulator [Anaerolineae bacterium]|nr:MarR family winged helix-turn-helix transcriptional regulator [Anaerolineae bacterium]
MQNDNLIKLNEIWHRFIKVANLEQTRKLYPLLKELSTSEVSLINILSLFPEINFSDICQRMQIPKSTLTSLVDRLEKKNYIKRVINKNDRRYYGLELTEEGRRMQTEHERFESEICQRVLNALDAEHERKIFLDLLEKVITNFESE